VTPFERRLVPEDRVSVGVRAVTRLLDRTKVEIRLTRDQFAVALAEQRPGGMLIDDVEETAWCEEVIEADSTGRRNAS